MKRNYLKRVMLCFLVWIGTAVNILADNVARVGTNEYSTLKEAVEAAVDGGTVTLISDVEVAEMIPVTKSITLELNGKTITNNVRENRLFRLSEVTFTIDGGGGKVVIPDSNSESYGFVDFRDAAGKAFSSTKLIVRNASFKGGTNEGSLFAFRENGQTIDFTNVDVELTESPTYSIINGYKLGVNISVSGGNYICNTTNKTTGVFQAGSGSYIKFDGVNVETTAGPVFEVIESNAVFSDCAMRNTATNSHFATCIAASNGGNVIIDGGSYESNYALYVYNSGGNITVNSGEFKGHDAVLKADDSTTGNSSVISVEGGSFDGKVEIGAKSSLVISGGTFNSDVTDYFAEGVIPVVTTDNEGHVLYTPAGGESYVNIYEGNPGDISDFTISQNIDKANVNYTRRFNGLWEAWFVPFTVELTSEILSNFDFAEIWDTELVNGNTTIEYVMMNENDVVEANIPYLVRAKNAGEQTISVSGAKIESTDTEKSIGCSTVKQNFNFTGVYKPTTMLDKHGWFFSDGALRFTNNQNTKLLPFRFYMTVQDKKDDSYVYPSTEQEAKSIKFRVIGDDSETTGINAVPSDRETVNDKIYNIQGLYVGNTVDGLSKGFYIVGDKKVVVK